MFDWQTSRWLLQFVLFSAERRSIKDVAKPKNPSFVCVLSKCRYKNVSERAELCLVNIQTWFQPSKTIVQPISSAFLLGLKSPTVLLSYIRRNWKYQNSVSAKIAFCFHFISLDFINWKFAWCAWIRIVGIEIEQKLGRRWNIIALCHGSRLVDTSNWMLTVLFIIIDSSVDGTILCGDANLWHHHQIGEAIEVYLDQSARFAYDDSTVWSWSYDYFIIDLGNIE